MPVLPLPLVIALALAPAETSSHLRYSLTAARAGASGVSPRVQVTIDLPSDFRSSRATLVMPRAIPMGYGRQLYDQFVNGLSARTRTGAAASVTREDGPRWSIESRAADDAIATIDYQIDLEDMEASILAGGDSSRSRAGFVSILGYSVFAFVEGLEDRAIDLTVSPPDDHPQWPVFSTLAPRAPAAAGLLQTRAADFYGLADSQILIGPGFRVKGLKATPDLFLAIHAEGPVDEAVMAPLAEQAFEALIRYFGSAPFPHFTLLFDYLTPRSPRHSYGFSMEHMESATFGALAEAALTPQSTDRARASWRYNVAHHLAHAWIPKRCAGEGYFPFRWELAPLIDTIWLSEGFGQYAAADALSDVLPAEADGRPYREMLVEARFRNTLRTMPDFLKRMPLVELSRVASTVYSEDFRTGRTVFSRGGLMAYEMDETLRARTAGRQRLRDALRGLVAWSAREKRPFRIDELSAIFQKATGVDLREAMERGLAALDVPQPGDLTRVR